MLHPATAMERLRRELLAEAWAYAKTIQAQWQWMTQQQRSKAVADLRRYRHVLDNFDTYTEAI